ncbi:MAG: CBS domain-containing protein [Candidatus Pacearchaeota archaeon]
MMVKELMKRPFIVEKDISLAEAAKIMGNKGIGSLLFMSGDKIKGIVTERDLIKNFGKHEKISQIMSTKVITIGPDESLDQAAEVMRERKIKRLPVVNEGKLVGIITLTDIMANFEALEEEFFFE